MEKGEVSSEILRQGNISLILDSYDDIFSDFDPRPFSEKALSDDFLVECKRAARNKDDSVSELRLLLPSKKRNFKSELQIKKRLREHFRKHYFSEEKKIKKIKKQGILWVFIGGIFIFLASLFYKSEGYLFNFIEILLTPAGWFTFWEGLGKIFIDAEEKKSNYIFYKKMISSRVLFGNYHQP